MKVAFVSSDFYPSLGGIQSWIRVILQQQANGIVLSPNPSKAIKDYPELKDVKILQKQKFTQNIFTLIKNLFQSPCDHFVCFQTGSSGAAAFLVSLISSKTYSVVCHGNEILRPRHSKLRKFVFNLVLKRAKFVLCNSQYTKHLLHQFYPKINTFVWYPAVEKIEVNRSPQKNVILTVASFLGRKGQEKIIQALDYLPDYEYWVVGSLSTKEKNPLEELAKNRNVKFFYNEDNTRKFFEKASICALLSTSSIEKDDVEGYGIFAVESLMMKIPCLVFNSGGLPETGAFVIDREASSEKIASAIKNLTLTNYNLQSDPKQALQKFQEILEAST